MEIPDTRPPDLRGRPKFDIPYREGIDAGRLQLSRESCPYPFCLTYSRMLKRFCWMNGHYDARYYPHASTWKPTPIEPRSRHRDRPAHILRRPRTAL